MDFGFTNDIGRLDAANAYREAAIADGWSCTATYGNEPVERAASLVKGGFKMGILARDRRGEPSKWKAEVSIDIWGPDGLVVKPPDEYDWAKIQAGVRTCNSCGATNVDTQRYSFAGRCCAKCLPEMRRKHERPGWCD